MGAALVVGGILYMALIGRRLLPRITSYNVCYTKLLRIGFREKTGTTSEMIPIAGSIIT